MSYDFRNRTWCSGSNTAPSRAERDEALENNRRFQCQGCGRAVTLTKKGLVPTHLASLETVRLKRATADGITRAVDKGGPIQPETLEHLLALLRAKTDYPHHVAVEVQT